MQTEMLQPWTTDKAAVLKTLKNKLISTKRSRISDAIANASLQLKDRPEGSRHVVMITDGVDSPGGKVDRAEAMRKLVAARATVHIISYTEFVRQNRQDSNGTCRCWSASTEFGSDQSHRSHPASRPKSLTIVRRQCSLRSRDEALAQSL